MTILLESRERTLGVKTLHANQDAIVVFSGEAYLKNLNYLVDAFTAFAVKDVGWSEEYSRYLATRGLGVDYLTGGAPLDNQIISFILDDPNKAKKVPSVMLFRDEISEPGQYIGFSAQRMFFPIVKKEPQQMEEEVPVMYHILRAFEETKRGKGRGRTCVELSLLVHKEARWYLHRTGNHVAAYTNTRSNSLDQEESYPWRHLYSENPHAYDIARKIATVVNDKDASEIDERGISRNAYYEPNLQVEVRRGHEGSIVIYRKMFEEWKMGPRDAIFPLLKVA